jgi:hypothetical protein
MLDEMRENLLPLVWTLTATFSNSEKCLQGLPDAFFKAWLHFVSAFVLAAELPVGETSSFRALPSQQLMAATDQLRKGEQALLNKLSKTDVEEYEVCSPRSITLLMLDRISQDIMRGAPDVAQIYSDYCQQLVRLSLLTSI